jgi:aspartate oxidase
MKRITLDNIRTSLELMQHKVEIAPDIIDRARRAVVGSGVAGLSTALGLEAAAVVSAGVLGSTLWAQGGIAAAVGRDDRPELHTADTMAVSGGLAVRDAVELLTEGGPAAIQRLVDLGARFDVDREGDLALGREAGHQRRRIIHAEGDRTGLEVMRALSESVIKSDRIEILEGLAGARLGQV